MYSFDVDYGVSIDKAGFRDEIENNKWVKFIVIGMMGLVENEGYTPYEAKKMLGIISSSAIVHYVLLEAEREREEKC